ncbi:pentapeptide repeat-containing protein [Enterobacter ludwigii]|uniref:pentapeptide repeat-containing protein n=1 Tax=Enterobacter ludwigii TaxID=299767 RepID=UPI003976AA81
MCRIKPEKIVGLNGTGVLNLCEINLAGADLRDADLTGAKLGGANLTGVNLGHVDLSKARFEATDTVGAGKAEDVRAGFYDGEAFIGVDEIFRAGS